MERILGISLGDVATDIFHNITKSRFHLLGFRVLAFHLPAAIDNITATLKRAVQAEFKRSLCSKMEVRLTHAFVKIKKKPN